MTLQSGYKLSRLDVVYTSKLRTDLSSTISQLKKALDLSQSAMSAGVGNPMPKRLQRRAWRVGYNKAPHAIGWSKRHYVFHDWRYGFEFRNANDVKYV